MNDALSLMWRDARFAPDLLFLMLVPVVLDVVPLLRRRWLAVLQLLGLAAQLGTWFSYYATGWADGWRGDVSPGAGVLAVMVSSAVNAGLAAIAWARSPRRRAPPGQRHGRDAAWTAVLRRK